MILSTEIEIAAPVESVWRTLTDFASYPEWNPFLKRVEGNAAVGERLTVRAEAPGGMPMTFRPTVLAATPNAELRWMGRLLTPGLFDGEHSFVLSAVDDRRTRMLHQEQFAGLLVPLFRRSLDRGTRRGFVLMNEALKRRVESQVATATA
jgi:hypothetical protein